MDSDHDDEINDLENLVDDDYMDNDEEYPEDDNDEDTVTDMACDDAADETKNQQQIYKVLTEPDIHRLVDEDVSKLSNILSISRSRSCTLLCYYKWNSNRVHDEWFSDEKSVRVSVGFVDNPVATPPVGKELRCPICFESCGTTETSTAACGHRFCNACWGQYVHTSISNGPGCPQLRCPEPSCHVAVDRDMILGFASDEDEHRFCRYLVDSYVEYSWHLKWCPAPGCDLAVSFVAGNSNNAANYDVWCGYKHNFCWNCVEDPHRPVPCETVAKRMEKSSAESENTNWILAYTKPCPKCRRNIEKNDGCNHMSCTAPCMHEFCWLCLGPWRGHGVCNQFDKDKDKESKRTIAKLSIERYMHYFERWATNQKAIADLTSMQAEKLGKLGDKQSMPTSQLKFVTEAWEQIVECRRVLKWTYAYGYGFGSGV